MTTLTLTAAPALTPLLARGALFSPLKRRPRPDAHVPPTRLVLPDVRIDLARLTTYERVCGFATGANTLPVTYPHVPRVSARHADHGEPLAPCRCSGSSTPR